MEFARRRIFYQKQDFQLAWEGLHPTPKLFHVSRQSHAPREALLEAGYFLGGALLADRFRIFKNGGLPLLERRSGPIIEEIVLRSSPYVCDEPFLPIRVYLHLSHARLKDVRIRYWRPASRAPGLVASMDLGQLELPPCYVIWNVGLDNQVLLELLDWVRRLALPWYDTFENSGELRRAIFNGTVAGLDMDRLLELVLAEFGPVEAARYLNENLLTHPRIGAKVSEAVSQVRHSTGVRELGVDPIWNVATIASAYSLI